MIKTLVERVQAGDHDAFAALVRRFQDMAVGYGYSLVGDQQLAEDVARDAAGGALCEYLECGWQ